MVKCRRSMEFARIMFTPSTKNKLSRMLPTMDGALFATARLRHGIGTNAPSNYCETVAILLVIISFGRY